MTHETAFSPAARDVRSLYRYIAARSGRDRALAYIERIEAFCAQFAEFPERGTRRDDLLPGLRVIGFERRVTIAFHIDAGRVTFDRILYAGRNLGAAPDDGW